MTVNTNITDKNNTSLAAWFEATPEYGKLIKLGVPDPVIGTIEGDIALYAENHGIDWFDDIPESAIIVAIADNTDTQTRLRVLWEYEDAELDGGGDGYVESIDRDQAVDDDGKAVFGWYVLTIDTSMPDDLIDTWEHYKFTAEDIETFARTW